MEEHATRPARLSASTKLNFIKFYPPSLNYFRIQLRRIPPTRMSADNPDEYGEIIGENFAISYPEKFP